MQAWKISICNSANSGNIQVVEDVNAKTKNNQTPADFVVRLKRTETTELHWELSGKTG